ncbi:MAG: sulfotransferase family 2 domain-containing protein [Sphingomicrobium sp.]
MIISALHKFIFVAIPKTGTHSVRQALREHMGPRDLEQVGLFVQKRFPIPELAQLQHGHLSLRQVQPYLRPEEWQSFFKFAFVRNPFDRFISYCAFRTRGQDLFERDPKSVMRHYLFEAPPQDHLLFQPQYQFVTGDDGQPLTDYVGRVERMQESYDEIAGKIGIPSRPLERINATERRDYRDYYDQQLIDGVARLYARDLELFGYQF